MAILTDSEKTEVLHDVQNIINITLQHFSTINERLDACGDAKAPSLIATTEPIKKAIIELCNRGVRHRLIIEITKDNISYCKQIIGFTELRHLNGIKGNFAVSEKSYHAIPTFQEAQPLKEVIISTVRTFVEQQQYFFETLWNKAIPAEQRIKEIEEGIKPDVIEILREPDEIQKLGISLARSAKEEVLIMFSTANAFHRQVGLLQLLNEIVDDKSKNVKIRIMTPADDRIRKTAEKLKEAWQKKIDIRYIEPPLQTKVSIVIVDKRFSLAVELKDDTKETSREAIGLATYSNSKATVLSYVSVFESLWNQTELYDHIRFLYEQLKDRDKLQKEFINIAAHELRTPIQPILGLAEVLREQASTPDQSKLLDAIIRNAKRLLQLQEDILDVARIESNLLKLDIKRFSLNQAILQVVEDFKDQIDSKKVKLVYYRHRRNNNNNDDIVVEADRNRLIQVLCNLVSNAVKLTNEGSVRIETQRKGNQVITSVKDTGPGIDAEIMPRLFTKFASKSEKGTGLGLFISKNIVEAHGGKIWAENNKDGIGATFSFTLPCVYVAPPTN